jgi:hypothetical protein
MGIFYQIAAACSTAGATRLLVNDEDTAALQVEPISLELLGYRSDGTATRTQMSRNYYNTAPPPTGYNSVGSYPPALLIRCGRSTQPFVHAQGRTNPVKNSLSNRFAPANTIVTYCAYPSRVLIYLSSEKMYETQKPSTEARPDFTYWTHVKSVVTSVSY